MKHFIIGLVTLSLIPATLSCLAEELTCLTDAEKRDAAFYSQLQQQAYQALDQRGVRYEQLKTPAEISAYQADL